MIDMDESVIQIVFSAVLAFATVAYTVATVLMLIESVKVRKQKASPCIVPYLKTSDDYQLVLLYVKNVGEGIARNVRIELCNDYFCFDNQNFPLSQYRIFQDGVSVFPSQYELVYILGNRESCLAANNDYYIELLVYYDDMKGKKNGGEHYKLLFQQIGQGYVTPPDSDIGRIAYYLKDISNSLNRISKRPHKNV